MNKIHLLWATIRPQMFIYMHKHWISNASNKDNIKTHVAVNTQSDKILIENYLKTIDDNYNIIIVETKYPGVCYPAYKLSSTLKYDEKDIIVFASDDFASPRGWDSYLESKLSTKSGILFVRDGYQLPNSSNMQFPAITIPIMDGISLNKMNNTIYHPKYHHMYSDCELYINAKDLGILIDDRISDTTTFEHHHHAAGKRKADDYDRSYYGKWQDDEKMWNKRSKMPVNERIKI